jgi:hypothetical protein
MKEEECPFFRRPESLSLGKGIGYCDISGNTTTCEADTKFCENPDALRQYLQRNSEKIKE